MTVFDPNPGTARTATPGAIPVHTATGGAERMLQAQSNLAVQQSRGGLGMAALHGAAAAGGQYMEELAREKALREAADSLHAETELRVRQQETMRRIEELRHAGTDEEIEEAVQQVLREAEDAWAADFLKGRDEGGVPFLRGGEGNAQAAIRLRSQAAWGQTRIQAQAWLAERHRDASLQRMNRAWEAHLEDPDRESALAGLRAVSQQLKQAGMDPDGVDLAYKEAERQLALRDVEEETLGAILATEEDPEAATEAMRALADELRFEDDELRDIIEEGGERAERARMLLAIPQVRRKRLATETRALAAQTDRSVAAMRRAASDAEAEARAKLEGAALNRLAAQWWPDGATGRRRDLSVAEIQELATGRNEAGDIVVDRRLYTLLLEAQEKAHRAEEGGSRALSAEEAAAEEQLLGELFVESRSPSFDREAGTAKAFELFASGQLSAAGLRTAYGDMNQARALSPQQREMIQRVTKPYQLAADDGGLFRGPDGVLAMTRPFWGRGAYERLDPPSLAQLLGETERYVLDHPNATHEDIERFFLGKHRVTRARAAGDRLLDDLAREMGEAMVDGSPVFILRQEDPTNARPAR